MRETEGSLRSLKGDILFYLFLLFLIFLLLLFLLLPLLLLRALWGTGNYLVSFV
jgi:hypothetical protein